MILEWSNFVRELVVDVLLICVNLLRKFVYTFDVCLVCQLLLFPSEGVQVCTLVAFFGGLERFFEFFFAPSKKVVESLVLAFLFFEDFALVLSKLALEMFMSRFQIRNSLGDFVGVVYYCV